LTSFWRAINAGCQIRHGGGGGLPQSNTSVGKANSLIRLPLFARPVAAHRLCACIAGQNWPLLDRGPPICSPGACRCCLSALGRVKMWRETVREQCRPYAAEKSGSTRLQDLDGDGHDFGRARFPQ